LEEADEAYKEGFAAGKRWAAHTATAKQLDRLASYLDGLDSQPNFGRDTFFHDYERQAYGPAEVLYFEMAPADSGSRGEAQAFWEAAIGEDSRERLDDGDFVRGFAEGAEQLWHEVQSQL
jgi:hypothetical protein